MDKCYKNEDRTLFTETPKDWKDEGYMPTVFVTKDEKIGLAWKELNALVQVEK